MSKKLYEESNIQDIANAIREQNGTENTYTPAQMPAAIRAIEPEPDLETLTVTENGNYQPSAGKDGFSSVAVNVPTGGGEAVIQSLSVTQNGRYNPPSGVDGYAPVTVNVSGGGGGGEGGVPVYTEIPDSSVGSDDDIAIVSVSGLQAFIHTPTTQAQANVTCGVVFTPSRDVKLLGILFYAANDHLTWNTSIKRMDTGVVIFNKTRIGVVNHLAWNLYPVSPILLEAGVRYKVWAWPSQGTMVWADISINPLNPNTSIQLNSFYSSTSRGLEPTTADNGRLNLSILTDEDTESDYCCFMYKSNGNWDLAVNPISDDFSIPHGQMILTGRDAPSASLGNDGDIYKQEIPILSNVNFVEYLESSGTQYIDTGIIADELTDITADVGWLANSYGLGKRSGNPSTMTNCLYIGTADSKAIGIYKTGSNSISFDSNKITVGSDNRVVCKTKSWKNDSNEYMIASYYEGFGGTLALKRVTSLNTTYSQILFGYHQDSTVYKGKIRIYRVTYYQAGAPVADYISCLDTNNVACMWDNIAQEYVYNDGTGDFAYGSAVTPDPLDPIYYVKKNGVWEVISS